MDDRVALSTRIYDHPSGRLGVFACDGDIGIVELTVARRDLINPGAAG